MRFLLELFISELKNILESHKKHSSTPKFKSQYLPDVFR